MKRTAIYLTALAIVPMMISSCRVYDSKEYMEEPAYLLAQAAYKNFVNPLLKSAELADFFARYQEIRSDREAALALADTYFPGGWGISELYYEMAAGYYGDIYLEDDGSFLVIPTWGMYYLSCSGVLSCDIYDIGFSVVPEGDRRYSISSVTIPDSYDSGASGAEAVISATVSCDDENMILEECLIELPECTVTSVGGAPVTRPAVYNAGDVFASSSGRLDYECSEESGVEDSFTLGFHDGYVTIERGTSVLKCKAFEKTRTLQYDYVIQ